MIRKLVVPQPVDDEDIEYPEEDGKPLGETGFHVRCTLWLFAVLHDYFREQQPDTHVACDLFFYYEKGNPKANKAPDIMVTKGIGGHPRRTFKTWVEKAVPCTIVEIVSRKSRREDTVVKPALFARLGVREYVLFDPVDDARLKPRFQGFRLRNGRLMPVKLDPDGGFTSTELGLRFVPEGDLLRVIELKSGRPLPFFWELTEAAKKLAEEKRRADELQAELERLRAQMRKRGKRR
jgi:Uma2 family endonuclease